MRGQPAHHLQGSDDPRGRRTHRFVSTRSARLPARTQMPAAADSARRSRGPGPAHRHPSRQRPDPLGSLLPAQSASAKVIQALPPEIRNRMTRCSELIPEDASILTSPPERQGIYKTILLALWEGKRLRLWHYEDDQKSQSAVTTLSLYRMARTASGWSLVGHSSSDRKVRVFEIPRIERLELTDEPYTIPPRFRLERFLVNSSASSSRCRPRGAAPVQPSSRHGRPRHPSESQPEAVRRGARRARPVPPVGDARGDHLLVPRLWRPGRSRQTTGAPDGAPRLGPIHRASARTRNRRPHQRQRQRLAPAEFETAARATAIDAGAALRNLTDVDSGGRMLSGSVRIVRPRRCGTGD